MKNYLLIISLIIFNNFYAQVAISNQPTVNSSATLEVSNYNNKGVLFPRVDIIDVFDNTKPVSNPADGLIVFNKGNSITPGVYIWRGGKWNLVSDTNNLVSYMMLQRTTDYTILGGSANGTFKNFNDAGFTVISNSLGASYNATTGVVTLQGNSGYIVNLSLNIRTALESATAGIGNTAVHLHQYLVKLIDPATGTQYGNTVSINATSLAASGSRTHFLNLSFTFATDSATPINLLPAIAHDAGGSYQNGSGGSSPNNGAIIITNAKLDIQRAIINQ